MNLVEKLLKIDKGELKKPHKTIKLIPKKLGIELELNLVEVDPEKLTEIQQNALDVSSATKGHDADINLFNLKVDIILESCKDLQNESLRKQFNVISNRALVKTLFVNGEINYIYSHVKELHEITNVTDDEIKN